MARPTLLQATWIAAAAAAHAEDLLPPSAERGAELWAKCKSCHTIEKGGRNIVGPNLHGVFGRRAGTAPAYNYSPANRAANLMWTDETLDRHLAETVDFLPGTKMYGARGDIDAIAEDLAFIDDDIANVDADAEFESALRRHAGVPLGHGALDLDRAARRANRAGERAFFVGRH